VCVGPATSPRCHSSIEKLSLDDKVALFAVVGRWCLHVESSLAYQQLLHHVRDNHVGA